MMTPVPCRASHLLALVLACVPHTPAHPLVAIAPGRLRHLHRRQCVTAWRAAHRSSSSAGDCAGPAAGAGRGVRGVAAATKTGSVTPVDAPPEESRNGGERRSSDTGVLNKVPLVAPAEETLVSGLKRASRLTATAGMAPEASDAAKARRRAAQQLDALTKALAGPLGVYVAGFPSPGRLHPFERALLDLTVGTSDYERTLLKVDALRKGVLELGKGHAGYANRALTLQDAEARRTTGFSELESLFRRGGPAVDALKSHAKALRSLPVAELRSPTLALVGAPNVGKSSLVRLLSSGTPLVANYPFTTRGVAMGHVISGDGTYRAVLTDTPGVLLRPDEARNRMERLTLAVLAFLPCGVMFVLDASGGCGVSLADQLTIRQELRLRFPDKPWLDVLSKWDLVQGSHAPVADDVTALVPADLAATALRVSVTTGLGTAQVRLGVHHLLERVAADVLGDS